MDRTRSLCKKNKYYSLSLFIHAGIALAFLFAVPQVTNAVEVALQSELNQDNIWETAFQQQIKAWISEIGKKDSRFSKWQSATFETYPFGPGSKQWVVIIFNQQGEEIGYLIMEQHSDEPLFNLVEYGHSEISILSKEVRSNPNFLRKDFFYSGLLWAKTEENTLVDLITREKYEHVPLEQVKPFWLGELTGGMLAETQQLSKGGQDPILFLAPALSKGESVNPEQLQDTEEYFYRAKLLPDVIGLYTVTSIHYWQEMEEKAQEKIYIGLEDEGTRYFCSSYLEQLGTFEQIN